MGWKILHSIWFVIMAELITEWRYMHVLNIWTGVSMVMQHNESMQMSKLLSTEKKYKKKLNWRAN